MLFQHIDPCFAYGSLFQLSTTHRPIAVESITERIIERLKTCPLIGRRSIVVASTYFQRVDLLQNSYVKDLHKLANPLRFYDLYEDEDVDDSGKVITYDGIVILHTSDMPSDIPTDYPNLWSRHIEPRHTPTLYLSISPLKSFTNIDIFDTDVWEQVEQQIAAQPPSLDNALS